MRLGGDTTQHGGGGGGAATGTGIGQQLIFVFFFKVLNLNRVNTYLFYLTWNIFFICFFRSYLYSNYRMAQRLLA